MQVSVAITKFIAVYATDRLVETSKLFFFSFFPFLPRRISNLEISDIHIRYVLT